MKTLKRTLISILSAAMLLTATPISAVDSTISVTVDGTTVDFPDQKPIIRNDRTLVPIRFIAE